MNFVQIYFSIGAVLALFHIFMILKIKFPDAERCHKHALLYACGALVAWPVELFVLYRYVQHQKMQRLPHQMRPTFPKMMRAVRKHFEDMPVIVLASNEEGLHMAANCNDEAKAVILKAASGFTEKDLPKELQNGND